MWTLGVAWLENTGGLILPVLQKQIVFSTILFLIVLVITALLRKQSPLLHLGLWMLVLIRLVLPTDLSFPISARNLLNQLAGSLKKPAATSRMQSIISDEGPSGDFSFSDTVDDSSGLSGGNAGTAVTARRSMPWKSVLFGGWMTGVLILLVVYLKKFMDYNRIVRKAESVFQKEMLESLVRWKSLYRIRRPVRLVTSDEYLSPFTVGIFRPVVYLPKAVAETGNGTLAEAVISHELAHVRCYDALWMKLQNLVQIAYFFHPVAWIAGSRIHLLRECICDSLVISKRKLSTETYGLGLLSVLKWNVFGTDEISILPGFGSPRKKVLQRIQNIKNTRNIGKMTMLLSAAGLIILALFILPMAGRGNKAEYSVMTDETDVRSGSAAILDYKSKAKEFVSIIDSMKSKVVYTAAQYEFFAGKGQDVLSVDSGSVARIFVDPRDSGKSVRVDYRGYWVTYRNIKEILVTEGQILEKWQSIGRLNQAEPSDSSRLVLSYKIDNQTGTTVPAAREPSNLNSSSKTAPKAFDYRRCANGIVDMVDLISRFADDAGGKFELIMPQGQEISSFKDGRVVEIIRDADLVSFPYVVWVQYPKYRLSYEGLDKVYVRNGETVKQWQEIGRLGKRQTNSPDSSKLVMLYQFDKIRTTAEGPSKTESADRQMDDQNVFSSPVEEGIVTSPFGKRRDPVSGSMADHLGVDIRCPKGTPVHAMADGTVLVAENRYVKGRGGGRHILIDHSKGFQTRYTQLDTVLVKQGQNVKRGEMIGRVGETGRATGPHLHYEVIKDGTPVDPRKYFPQTEKQSPDSGRIDKATSDVLIHQLQEHIGELTLQKAAYEAQLASPGMPDMTDAKLAALEAQIRGLKRQWSEEIINMEYPEERMADSLSAAICAGLQRNLAKEILDQGSYENQLVQMGMKPSDDSKWKQMGMRIDGMKKELTRQLAGKGGAHGKNIKMRLAPEIMRECLERLGELIPAKAAYLSQLKRNGYSLENDAKLGYFESAIARLTKSMEENLKYLPDGKNKKVNSLIAQAVVPALQKEAVNITIDIASYKGQLGAMKTGAAEDEKLRQMEARLAGIQDEIVRQKQLSTKE